jgi:hypothetical protein
MKALLIVTIITLSLALPGSVTLAAGKKPYLPQKWEMTVKFLNFPYDISCAEEHGRGTVVKSGSGRSFNYRITGFPAADRLICEVPNGRSFAINMKFLFGTGNTKRVMGRSYFEGEIRRIDLKVQHHVNTGGYGSYKAHVKLFTTRGKDRVIYSDEDMLYAFFPDRANLPERRWKE